MPVTLELGGKSPVVLGRSADLEKAGERVAMGKMMNAGQICLAPDYMIVPEENEEAAISGVQQGVENQYPTLLDNEDYASVVTDRHFDRLQGMVADAKEKGADVIEVNPADEDFSNSNGRKMPLTILRNVTDDMLAMQEEIFGPVLPVKTYKNVSEAIDYVNANDRPLGLYYFGEDAGEREQVLKQTASGGVTVNDVIFHISMDDLPFGGVGPSGIGSYHGPEGFKEFSHTRSVYQQPKIDVAKLAGFKPPYGAATKKAIATQLEVMRVLAGFAGALLLSACAYAPPTPISASGTDGFVVAGASAPVWQPVQPEAGQAKDIAGLQVLSEAFPDSSSVHLRLLQTHVTDENIAGAVKEALWLAERGYSFNAASRKRLIALTGNTAVAARLEKLLDNNAVAIEKSEIVSTFPASAELVESVALDPTDSQIYATTVVSRNIVTRLNSGTELKIEPDNVDSLSGIATDARAGFLWVAAGNLGMTPKDTSLFGGLLRFEKRGKGVAKRFPAPEGVTLSDIAVSADGTVFASSPMGGGVYWLRDKDIKPLISPGTFRSPQGLAESADGTKLYVSDYRYGIAVIDLATKSVSRLKADTPMILDGFDGMWRHGNRLIGVQNGMSPMRIVSIELSADGLSAMKLDVLEQAHPDWTEPLGGTIHQGSLYYVATGQWDRFDKEGKPKAGKPPIPTEIRRLPL